jgi:hypothetical protein
MSPDYAARVLDAILDLLVERSWDASASLHVAALVDGLRVLFPARVVVAVLRVHAQECNDRVRAESGADSDGEDEPALPPTIVLSGDSVCRAVALRLLAHRQPFPHREFMTSWRAAVPPCMADTCQMSVLRGLALCEMVSPLASMQLSAAAAASGATATPSTTLSAATAAAVALPVRPISVTPTGDERTCGGQWQWRLFPASALSPHARARFAQLFAVRAQWRADDLEPYLAAVLPPGMSMQQMLMREARAISAVDGQGKKTFEYTKK